MFCNLLLSCSVLQNRTERPALQPQWVSAVQMLQLLQVDPRWGWMWHINQGSFVVSLPFYGGVESHSAHQEFKKKVIRKLQPCSHSATFLLLLFFPLFCRPISEVNCFFGRCSVNTPFVTSRAESYHSSSCRLGEIVALLLNLWSCWRREWWGSHPCQWHNLDVSINRVSFCPLNISRELDKVVITNVAADTRTLIFPADKHAFIMPIPLTLGMAARTAAFIVRLDA